MLLEIFKRGRLVLDRPTRTDKQSGIVLRARYKFIAIGASAVMMTALFIGTAEPVSAANVVNSRVRVRTPRLANRSAHGNTFRVRWKRPLIMAGTPIARFHVLYREQSESSFKPLPSIGSEVTAARSAIFVGEPDRTYIFKVRGEDARGHIGAAARSRTIVPIDDIASQHVQYNGVWTSKKNRRFYLRSEHQSREAGAVMTYSFDGRRVWLIGTKGPGRGEIDITLDGVNYGSIDLHASKMRPRQTLWSSPKLKPISSIKRHRLKVEVVGTPGRPLVGIDALARLK